MDSVPIMPLGASPFQGSSRQAPPPVLNVPHEQAEDDHQQRVERDLAHAATDIAMHAGVAKLKGDDIIYGPPGGEGLIDKAIGNAAAAAVTALAEAATDGAVTPVAPLIYAGTEKAVSALASAFTPKAAPKPPSPPDVPEAITSQQGEDDAAPPCGMAQKGKKKKGSPPGSVSCAQGEPKRLKFGAESVHPTGVLDKLAINCVEPDGDSNLFTSLPAFCAAHPGLVAIEAHQVSVTSNLYRCGIDSAVGAPVAQAHIVLPTVAAPIADAAAVHVKVRFQDNRMLARLDPSVLEPYKIGTVINGKAVNTALEPKLMPSNNNLLTRCADLLFDANVRYDMTALYAKGMLYSMQIDLATEADNVVVAEAFPAGAVVTYINLDDNALTPEALRSPIQAGNIMLLENVHYVASDLQVIYWLAAQGRRVGAAADVQNSMANYTIWPAIHFTLLKHGAADAAPAAALVTSLSITSFLSRLASTRGEYDDFLRGLSVALDLIGTKYHLTANIRYGRTSDINIAPVSLPAPHDYNFLLRVLGYQFGYTQHSKDQVISWLALNSNTRVRAMGAWSALRSAAVTTIMTSINATTNMLIGWCTGNNQFNQGHVTFHATFCSPEGGDPSANAPMYDMIRAAIAELTGFLQEPNLYPGSWWNGMAGATANAENALEGFTGPLPPQDGTVLCIDEMLLTRPQEWGIVGPNPIVNFTSDLREFGPAAQTGLWTADGEPAYSAAARGPQPYYYVPYGAQVANIAHRLGGGNNRALWKQTKAWHYGSAADWSEAVLDGNAVFLNPLSIFKPCTILTYDWATAKVAAAVIRRQDLNNQGVLMTLRQSAGKPLSDVGFATLRSTPYPAVQFTMPTIQPPKSRRQRLAEARAPMDNVTPSTSSTPFR